MLPHRKYLNLEQRVEIAHGLAHGEPLKSIAERIGLPMVAKRKKNEAPNLYCITRAIKPSFFPEPYASIIVLPLGLNTPPVVNTTNKRKQNY